MIDSSQCIGWAQGLESLLGISNFFPSEYYGKE
jgi:hypothetical protein